MVSRLFDLLRPDQYVTGLECVDLDHLYEQGYRALLIDRDKTLTGWREQRVTPQKHEWLMDAVQRFEVCIVSNTIFIKGVNKLGEELDLPVVSRWGLGRKPMPGAIRAALEVVQVPPEKSVMIGDQLFTDILGGNLMGLHTILSDPVPGPEFFATRILRLVEGRFIAALGIHHTRTMTGVDGHDTDAELE